MARDESELWRHTSQNERRTSKVRVAALAAKQCGQITWVQLKALDVSDPTISRWRTSGFLVSVLPRVYAVGPVLRDEKARFLSLALFAGPSAELSHGSCAHWRGWLRYPVRTIHVSTPRRIYTRIPGVIFHCRRELERELVNGVPCTTVTQTLLDVAATESLKLVHRCLAQLDYDRKLNPRAIRAACGRGRPGSTRLLQALDSYMPQLAHTKSGLEDEFLYLCQRAGLPLPVVNASIHNVEPDCYWPDLKLVVELDGGGNHGTGPQRTRDQRKALTLRAHGIDVIRYTEDQVFLEADQVTTDLCAEIEKRRQRRRA